ncbi:hypothetical protein V6N11_049716 [Hibiscus sabdariffa]|uniref:Uncharacterized protein n=2 Tax=Hibiscus sabdariffa TaxID=183260 RepID=A0ABR2B2Y8_9ROSI
MNHQIDDDPPDKGGLAASAGSTADLDNIPNETAQPILCYEEPLMKDSVNMPYEANEIIDEEDIEIEEGNVVCSVIDGLISINFLELILILAEKSLDQTMVVKLLS